MSEMVDLSFDTLWQNIKKSIAVLYNETEYYQNIVSNELIEKLIKVSKTIGSEPVSVSQPASEIYREQWDEFDSGRRKGLDKRAVRYLCWEPRIALRSKFINFIEQSNTMLTAQSIHALVRSCHMKWSDNFPESSIAGRIRMFVRSYTGPNQLIKKWQEHLEMILGSDGANLFAGKMLDVGMAPDQIFKEWGIDAHTAFAHDAVINACNRCRGLFDRSNNSNDYFLKELLPWENWELSCFKSEIENTIMNRNIMAVQDQFQSFVLRDARLGDPRLPRNTNWSGISPEAKKTFISWLSRRDIVFFFEHVLPRRKDPHGRKVFWLQYVNKLLASRPLLCEQDMVSFRSQIDNKQINYGSISGINSVFILDFGTIVAVEFSRVGACFIYSKNNFIKIVSDIFGDKRFSEGELKQLKLVIKRVVHRTTTNCNWRDDVSSILAQHGIRRSS